MRQIATPLLLAFVSCAPALAPTLQPTQVATPPPAPAAVAAPAIAASTEAPTPPPVDARTARLVRLCNVWGQIRTLHPWVVEGAVDWDAALVAALPKALAAQNDDDEVAAVRTMLDALHDPATRVDRDAQSPVSTSKAAPPEARTVDGVRIIPVAIATWDDLQPARKLLEQNLATAKLAVIDLRASTGGGRHWANAALEQVAAALPSHDATTLEERVVEHQGYHPQDGVTFLGYRTFLATPMPTAYAPAKKPHPSRIVFVASTASTVPDVAWAMQRAGDAAVVMQGPLPPDALAEADEMPLVAGARVYLRRAEVVGPAPRPDVQLDAAAPEDKVLDAAVRAAKQASTPRRPEHASSERPAAWRPDPTYADEPYPSRDHRILALFRFWTVIRWFYPYLPLMGDAWDRALVEFLPRFENATDAREYAFDVAELAACIPDSHVRVWGSRELKPIRGEANAPFEARVIEGKVVVTSLQGDATLASAGISAGDVVEAVDGEPMATRMARLGKYIAASTDAWRQYRTAAVALQGDAGSTLRVTLRGADGKARDVSVPRTTDRSRRERAGPVYHRIGDDIGYVDLTRLDNADVDAMFAAFDGTRAIVFDMRGYPHGTAGALARHLNVKRAKMMAQIFQPFVSPGQGDSIFTGQWVQLGDRPVYRGKTVMLVDERTLSQAEHLGLFLEAAAGTTFIGSQTAGADGDVTNLSVPGGLYVSFTGLEVRHADGRQLQRIGLVPDVEIGPTIAGIRAGRDEVLERALAYAREGR